MKFDRGRRWDGERVINRHLVVAARVIGAHIDAARRLVDVDPDVVELPAIAVGSLDRLD